MAAYQLLEFGLIARRGSSELRAVFVDSEALRLGSQMIGAAALAAAVAWLVPALAIPGEDWTVLILGVLVMCAGVGVRLWAVVVLGRFFRPIVVLQANHQVITSGPYRFVRHPSYTGMLLVQVGFGIALGNLLSIAICIAIPLYGLLSRIAHEEAALSEGLGSEYRTYAARTSRLVPGVW